MTKTKAGGGINWIGTTSDDIKIGSDGSDVIRGSGGNDTLTGGKSSDRFVFESSLSLNGVDVIKDFSVKSSASPFNYDVLDLSLVLSKNKKITSSNINDYVYVAGDKLCIDLDGKGSGTAEVWATLEGVKMGDQLNVRTSSFDAWITAKASESDTTEPVFNPNASYSYSYLENQEAGGIVATVVGASDNVAVTQYRFVDSAGVVSGTGATSADGFFVISSDGKVTITAAGVATGVAQNDYETGLNLFSYDIQAGDAAGNWSEAIKIELNVGDVGEADKKYLTSGRSGVWFEDASTANGILDNGESLVTGASLEDANSDGFYTIAGLDIAASDVTVRFVDAKAATKLDLTGFGTGDKIVLDANTNASSFYGFDSYSRQLPYTNGFSYVPGPKTALAGVYVNVTLGNEYYYHSAFFKKTGSLVKGLSSLYRSSYINGRYSTIAEIRNTSQLAKGLEPTGAAGYTIEVINAL